MDLTAHTRSYYAIRGTVRFITGTVLVLALMAIPGAVEHLADWVLR